MYEIQLCLAVLQLRRGDNDMVTIFQCQIYIAHKRKTSNIALYAQVRSEHKRFQRLSADSWCYDTKRQAAS